MSIIDQNVLDSKTAGEAQAVYVKPNGNNERDGSTESLAKKTYSGAQGAIAQAATLNPQFDERVSCRSESAANYNENITLPNFINIRATGSSFVGAAAGAVISVGTNCRVTCDEIRSTLGDCLLIDGNSLSLIDTSIVDAQGAGFVGFKVTGNSGGSFFRSEIIKSLFRCIENTSTATFRPTYLSHDTIEITGSNGTGVYQNGAQMLYVKCHDLITSAPGANIGIDVVTGTLRFQCLEISLSGEDAIIVRNGGTLSLDAQKVSGDITVNAGGTLNTDVIEHVGTLTNNGTINGIINGTPYGTFDQPPGAEGVNQNFQYNDNGDRAGATGANYDNGTGRSTFDIVNSKNHEIAGSTSGTATLAAAAVTADFTWTLPDAQAPTPVQTDVQAALVVDPTGQAAYKLTNLNGVSTFQFAEGGSWGVGTFPDFADIPMSLTYGPIATADITIEGQISLNRQDSDSATIEVLTGTPGGSATLAGTIGPFTTPGLYSVPTPIDVDAGEFITLRNQATGSNTLTDTILGLPIKRRFA